MSRIRQEHEQRQCIVDVEEKPSFVLGSVLQERTSPSSAGGFIRNDKTGRLELVQGEQEYRTNAKHHTNRAMISSKYAQ